MADIAVIGAGSWGTAIAVLLAKKGYLVNIWGREEKHIASLLEIRENSRYLPGVALPREISPMVNLEEALSGVKYIVLSVPSHAVRETCTRIKELVIPHQIIINTAKGIELSSLKRLSEVIGDELQEKEPEVAVLSGPSHAEEVGKELPTAVVVGSQKKITAEIVQDLFMAPKFRVYTNPDLIGIEIGAALKNVIALGTGVAEGLGFGDNTKAALITRGATEIARLGVAMGADPLTFAGLTGIGDLIVTCTSMHSRNRRAGLKIGQGTPLSQVLSEMGMVVEGVKATQAGYELSKLYGISMPICEESYNVLFNGKNAGEAVVSLMMRQKKHEVEEVVHNMDW